MLIGVERYSSSGAAGGYAPFSIIHFSFSIDLNALPE
jgi:hypothetical protein